MAELGNALLICFASWIAQSCVACSSTVACQGNSTCGTFFGSINCIICLVALFFMIK